MKVFRSIHSPVYSFKKSYQQSPYIFISIFFYCQLFIFLYLLEHIIYINLSVLTKLKLLRELISALIPIQAKKPICSTNIFPV